MYRREHSRFAFLLFALCLLFALPVFAQEATTTPQGALLRDGVFGCNASKYQNPGTLAAVGGVYVPVNDAAVTINTGYLVYKECVLDGVIGKVSEAARTELVRTTAQAIETGRAGQQMYRQSFDELTTGKTEILVTLAKDQAFIGTMSQDYRTNVVQAYARRFARDTQQPNQSFATTYPGGSPADFYRNNNFTFDGLLAMVDPCNNPRGNYEVCFGPTIDSLLAEYDENQRQEWLEGGGFYPVTDENPNPLERLVLTPASLVGEGARQVFTGGFRCLEGADELSEICAPLFSGLSTQLIADSRGLTGITQSQSGLPSYLNRMVQEASSAVQQEAVNAALSILSTARQVEALFKQAKEATATVLTTAINRLRTAEATCWDLIIQNVCTAAPVNNTCTAKPNCAAGSDPSSCTSIGTLHIATSTQFSQPIITQQIAPRGIPVATDIQASETALGELDQLIANVNGSSSATNQRQALERLDSLVANNMLHNGNDVVAARGQTDIETTEMNRLVEDTLALWGDSQDANVGWCNVNSPAVINRWTQAWRQ